MSTGDDNIMDYTIFIELDLLVLYIHAVRSDSILSAKNKNN
jgi:hypothetical protein